MNIVKAFGLVGLMTFAGCWGNNKPAPDPFALPVTYPVGKKPTAVVAHDMNLDGFPDILVTNSEDATLHYYEGVGNGAFKEPVIMKTGREPVAMAVADFNGDDIPDIAVSNYGDGSISIILGQKDGIFKLKEPVKIGKLPLALVAGDFNNDRKPDLAVTLRFDKLVILLGTGNGQFNISEPYNAPGSSAGIVAGDYNSDKNIDLAMTSNTVKANNIQIFFGTGDGTFKAPEHIAGGGQSPFLTQYDMNHDGMIDLIVSNPVLDSLTLFLGDGKGGFQKMPDFSAEKAPGALVAGEFTDDKFPDLVVCNRDGSISVLEGRGDGSFIFPHYNYPVGRHPQSITAADFNRDGLLDLALILSDDSLVEIIMRKTSATSAEEG